MHEELLVHQRVIRQYLGRYGFLSPCEALELEQAYDEVKSIQEHCFHQFHPSSLFTSDALACDYCGLVKPKLYEAG